PRWSDPHLLPAGPGSDDPPVPQKPSPLFHRGGTGRLRGALDHRLRTESTRRALAPPAPEHWWPPARPRSALPRSVRCRASRGSGPTSCRSFQSRRCKRAQPPGDDGAFAPQAAFAAPCVPFRSAPWARCLRGLFRFSWSFGPSSKLSLHQPIGTGEEFDRVIGAFRYAFPVCRRCFGIEPLQPLEQVHGRQGAFRGDVPVFRLVDVADHGLSDLKGGLEVSLHHPPGTTVSRTTGKLLELGFGYKFHHLPRLVAHVLGARMAGDMQRHPAIKRLQALGH